MKSRLERLRAELEKEECRSFFISGMENLRYLTGFTGSAGLGWVASDTALLFVDPRYHIQAREESRGFEVVPCQQKLLSETAVKLHQQGTPSMGVEKNFLTLGQYLQLQEEMPQTTLHALDGVIEKLRMIKEPEEVARIKDACRIVDLAHEHILSYLKEGVSEREVALEIDYFMRRHGADKSGFDTIVAFGPHSAYPHARPTDDRLERGQFVKMDYGARKAEYNSDLTRTVVFGPLSDRHREIYEIVLEAQQRALDAIRPGILGKEADAAARDAIAARGYGDQFGHGLGHALGREVHDGGALNRASETMLEPGQVWTVEPGIYVEGFGGVRIEDDVVVTESGNDVLTFAPKALCVIEP